MKNEQAVPSLVLRWDGYQIETVFTGRWHSRTGWILLHRVDVDRVQRVASGWKRDYEAARREAFEAMKAHKADVEAVRR